MSKKLIPTVNEMGIELESLGLVSLVGNTFEQTGPNCYDIAKYLAERFGYKFPDSREKFRELVSLISFWDLKIFEVFERIRQSHKGSGGGWDEICSQIHYEEIPKIGQRSRAAIVFRKPDCESSDGTHVAFELYGMEYNYGATTKQGYPISVRVPLAKKA